MFSILSLKSQESECCVLEWFLAKFGSFYFLLCKEVCINSHVLQVSKKLMFQKSIFGKHLVYLFKWQPSTYYGELYIWERIHYTFYNKKKCLCM